MTARYSIGIGKDAAVLTLHGYELFYSIDDAERSVVIVAVLPLTSGAR